MSAELILRAQGSTYERTLDAGRYLTKKAVTDVDFRHSGQPLMTFSSRLIYPSKDFDSFPHTLQTLSPIHAAGYAHLHR